MTPFNFGAQTQTPALDTSGFSFLGSTNTTSTPSFATSFSNPATNVSGTTGFNFGSTVATPASNIFGNSSGFPSSAASTTSLLPALGQTATSTGFNLGGSFGTSSLGGIGFGTGTGFSNTNTGFGGTGIGFSGASTGFGGTTATTTTSTIGLGGVDLQASSIHEASATAKKDKAVKETFIPNELMVTMDAFKKHIKEQKTIREEMARVSSKDILKGQNQIAALKLQLSVISNGLQRNESAIAKLKQESLYELRNAEIIQRTKDTPIALQCENTAPSAYFDNLATSFQNQMQSYRLQIEQLERHLVSLSQPSTMTPNELTVVMKRLHDAFVTLAAQLQTAHQAVQYQKDQFLALKANENDTLNIFSSRSVLPDRVSSSSMVNSKGPNPLVLGSSAAEIAVSSLKRQQFQGFIGSSGTNLPMLGLNNTSFLNSSLNNNFGTSNVSAFKPLGSSMGATAAPAFGVPSFGIGSSGLTNETIPQSPFSQTTQKPFQLQKPPTGNKRGKRYTSA